MSRSVTAWKYWYHEHHPTWYGVRVRARAAAPAQSAQRSSSTCRITRRDADRVQLAGRVRRELGTTEIRVRVDLDQSVVEGPDAKGSVVPRAAVEPEEERAVVVGEHGDELAAQITHGCDRAVGVVHVAHEPDRTGRARRILARPRARPSRSRSTTGSRAGTRARGRVCASAGAT